MAKDNVRSELIQLLLLWLIAARGLLKVWSVLCQGITAVASVVKAVMVEVMHWCDAALRTLWHGLRVIWSLLDRGFTATFRYLKIGLTWVLDHLRDLLTALIHGLQRALTRLAALLISFGQVFDVTLSRDLLLLVFLPPLLFDAAINIVTLEHVHAAVALLEPGAAQRTVCQY